MRGAFQIENSAFKIELPACLLMISSTSFSHFFLLNLCFAMGYFGFGNQNTAQVYFKV